MNVAFLIALLFAFVAFTSGFVSALVVGEADYPEAFVVGFGAASVTLLSFLVAWLVVT